MSRVGPGRKLVLLALAAGLLRAADTPNFLYKFHLPGRAVQVDWTPLQRSDWDVTVRVDPANCEIICEYRLKTGRTAARLVAPPAMRLRVFTDFVSLPLKLTLDPGGVENPSAMAQARAPSDSPYLPGRKLIAFARPERLGTTPATGTPAERERPAFAAPAATLAAPLRL